MPGFFCSYREEVTEVWRFKNANPLGSNKDSSHQTHNLPQDYLCSTILLFPSPGAQTSSSSLIQAPHGPVFLFVLCPGPFNVYPEYSGITLLFFFFNLFISCDQQGSCRFTLVGRATMVLSERNAVDGLKTALVLVHPCLQRMLHRPCWVLSLSENCVE